MTREYAGMARAYLVWWTQSLGYWIRPYHMLADARRWRWQARTRCTLLVPRWSLIPKRSETHGDQR